MKQKTLLILVILLGMVNAASANRFYLSAQRVFSEDEVVKINCSNYYYYQEGKNKQRKLTMRLFKVKDVESIISHPAFQGYYNLFPDSVINTFEEVKSWEYEFTHNTYSNVVDLGKLKSGLYILDAYEQGEVAQIPIFVSNYSLITKSSIDEMVCYMANTQTGIAVKDFKAKALLAKTVLEATNYDNGLAAFKWKGKGNYIYPTVLGIKGNKIAVSKAYFYNYYRYSGQNGLTSYLFTDRSAYRPEQTVKIKGILRIKDKFRYKIPADSITYQITGPQGTQIVVKNVALDGMGTFSDSLKLTKEMKLGSYTIRTRVMGKGSYDWQNQYTFLVEEYKKPEYEVTVSLDKNQYVLGDQIKAEVTANYFFGSPVKNATVTYRVIREQYYVPYWRSWAYSWWYEEYYGHYTTNREVVKYGTGQLNEDGTFSVEIPTEESNKDNRRNYRYTVMADVRDASRRTITGSSTTMVAYTEYSITAYSEKYYYDLDEEASVLVSTADLSGQPIGTNLTATVYRQFWENHKWTKDKVGTYTVNTQQETGEAELTFQPKQAGYYHIEFEGKDKRDRKVTTTSYLYVIQEGDWSYNWWHNNSASIQIMTDKKVYQSGEKVKAVIITKHNVDALVTASSQNLAYSQLHYMKGKQLPEKGADQGGMKTLELTFDADASGKIDIAVNYVYQGKLYQRVEKITFIPAHKYMNVSITFDKKDYKPRTWAEATIKVTDQDGQPVPNAQVVLSTADESIYSLYPDKTPDIRKVFYKNQEYTSYSSTYHNNFGTYKYSRKLKMKELLARLKRYDEQIDRRSIWTQKSWYHLAYGEYTKEGTIRGFVFDKETGNPLKNIQIKAKGKTFKTNEYGYYSMRGFENDYVDLMFIGPKGKAVLKHVLTYKNRATIVHVEIDRDLKDHDFYPNLTSKQLKDWQEASKHANTGNGGSDDVMTNGIALVDEVEEEAEEAVFSLDAAAEGITTQHVREVVATSAMRKEGRAMAKHKADVEERSTADKPATDYKEATIRRDFQDAIYWNPVVTTNSLGLAKVRIKLPDNLTTWRTTVRVVTQDTKVGQTIAKTIVRKNLLVRMETPRFMTVGDELLIATNIHNYLSEGKSVKVSLLADGVEVAGSTQTIQVGANGEERIDWKVDATWAVNAKLTVKALTDEESDAKEVKVPVKPFGLEMITASASYLQNDAKNTLTITIPKGTDLNTVNLELSAAPSITSALLSAMDDLIGYPYGCVEQTMSRFLPNVLVANTLKELGGNYQSNISEEELLKMVNKGLERLGQLQQNDGGWGWWRNDSSSPYYTAYVSNGLHLAKKAGYTVDQSMYSRAVHALSNQLSKRLTSDNVGEKSSTLYAYQMMVAMQCELTKLWDKKSYKADKVKNSYEAALWLQAAHLVKDEQVMKEMTAWLEQHVQKEGGMYFWGGEKFYYSWQKDQVETTANAVRALAMINPDHELLPGAAQWLLMKRKGKSWHNTRQTAMTIYGMNELIKKDFNPDMAVELYVNGTKLDNLVFVRGSKGKNYQIKGVSFMAAKDEKMDKSLNLLNHGDNTIRLVQKGKGTSYVNAKLTYFLDGKDDVKAVKKNEQPFKVKREYFKLERKFDKHGKLTYKKVPIAQSEIKSGDDIFVKTKITSSVDRDHILIEDPIPAGCEFVRDTKGYIVEGESNYTGQYNYYGRRNYYSRWSRWYTHQEFRDEKFAMTITKLYKGDYEYSYILKAQIPGKFNITPAVSQLMYYPEIRGFSDFETLEIKE
ncbi:MAG: alpha-2-macroglobulin family protein [Flammeovirgaceae bacterium]